MSFDSKLKKQIIPDTHFMRMIRAVDLKGANANTLVYDNLWLFSFIVICIEISSIRFKNRLD